MQARTRPPQGPPHGHHSLRDRWTGVSNNAQSSQSGLAGPRRNAGPLRRATAGHQSETRPRTGQRYFAQARACPADAGTCTTSNRFVAHRWRYQSPHSERPLPSRNADLALYRDDALHQHIADTRGTVQYEYPSSCLALHPFLPCPSIPSPLHPSLFSPPPPTPTSSRRLDHGRLLPFQSNNSLLYHFSYFHAPFSFLFPSQVSSCHFQAWFPSRDASASSILHRADFDCRRFGTLSLFYPFPADDHTAPAFSSHSLSFLTWPLCMQASLSPTSYVQFAR